MDRTEKPSVLVNMFAGAAAGFSETVITYPAEFLKTRRQLPPRGGSAPSSISLLRSTIKTVGFSGLYSGCEALAVTNAGKSCVRFMSFDAAKHSLKPVFGLNNPWTNVCAGLVAGAAESLVIVTPGEVIKTRLIHEAATGNQTRAPITGLTASVLRIVRENGIASLWKGLTPVLCKQGTNSAVRFGTFGLFQDWSKRLWPGSDLGIAGVLIPGMMSGVVTTYASMPFDNIKTRLQSIGSTHKSTWSCAQSMLRDEGIAVFWKATTPRLLRLVFSSGITFVVYDEVVKLIKRTHFPVRELVLN